MVEQSNLCSKLIDLIESTGYPIVQNNGQRKFGPPRDWIGPSPPKGCELFIGKLPREIFEDILVPVFSRPGKIYELRLMMDFSGSNRGFAFVTYTCCGDAAKAVRELDNYEIIPGHRIGVVKSVDNCRLFVGSIPKTKTKSEVMEEMSKHVAGIVNVHLYKNRFDKKLNRGFAFIEFVSHRAAAMARRALVPSKIQLFDKDVNVDWAEPEPVVNEEEMKTVKILYIRNLSISTTAEDLRNIIGHTTKKNVERIKKMYDYAFVHFYEREDAEFAMKFLQGFNIDGENIEIKWAKPVNRKLYRMQKLLKGNAKFNRNESKCDNNLIVNNGHNSRAGHLSCSLDEGINSSCAPESSYCGSPDEKKIIDSYIPKEDAACMAITTLDSMCKRFHWSAPKYTHRKYITLEGVEVWSCTVEIDYVGHPLFKLPTHIGPLVSNMYMTMQSAQANAAHICLSTFKAVQEQTMMPQQEPELRYNSMYYNMIGNPMSQVVSSQWYMGIPPMGSWHNFGLV